MQDQPPRAQDDFAVAHREWLTERVAHYLGRPVDDTVSLAEEGLDSVAGLSLYGDIEEEFGSLIEPEDIWAYPTLRQLADFLAMRDVNRGGSRVRAAFVFTGQGSQHPGMTSGLYLNSTGYRAFLDEADAAITPWTKQSVVKMIFADDPGIHRTAMTQPALFAVEYALARTLEEAGVHPVAVLGHGIGEFAAATVAGALTLADAAKLVSMRGAFMQYLPPGGGMMATCVTPYEAAELVAAEPAVGISAINAAKAVVLSGDKAALERIEVRLEERGVPCRHLAVSHAFHSPLMAPVVAKFEAIVRRMPGGAARVPFYSTVYGRLATEPLHAPYWTEQITAPVRFADAARSLLAQQTPTHVVEIGPQAVLTPYLRRMGGGRRGPVCLPVCQGPASDAVDLAGVISALDAGPLAAALSGA
ncbi:acyltransferase domain-containing protein [Streptomyces sp. NBC_01341]|uniref:acyltransferase domain-containing protein n=1 Tax=Streptomyces sp. NBC_01341 TaxID=2903831 RepID=UPI002E12E26A|nr:acyltransferase domain-containing protein [Streptomyces sp. NBC_01341]